MSRPPKHGVPIEELAALAGVAARTLAIHARSQCPMPAGRDGLESWLRDYHAWRDAKRRKTGPVADGERDDKLAKAKRRLAELRAQELQMRVDRLKGKLIDRGSVVQYAAIAVQAVSQRLEALVRRASARLGPQCQGGEAAVEEFLRAEVDEIRSQFAAGMGRAHGE